MYLLKTLQWGLILLPALSFGQLRIPRDTLLKIYDRQTILLLNEGVMQDGRLERPTMFSNPIKKVFRNDSTAYKMFKKSNWQGLGGGLCATIGVFPILTGVMNLNGKGILTQTEATASTLGGTLMFGFGVWILNKSLNGLYETAWLYNRNSILSGLHSYQDSLNQGQILRSYEQNSIRLTQSGFYHNGRYEAIGILGFSDPLKNRLRPNVAAYNLYRRGSLYRNAGQALGYASVLGGLYSLTNMMDVNNNITIFRQSFKITIISSAVLLLGGLLELSGDNDIQKAVWFYNRNAFVHGVF